MKGSLGVIRAMPRGDEPDRGHAIPSTKVTEPPIPALLVYPSFLPTQVHLPIARNGLRNLYLLRNL